MGKKAASRREVKATEWSPRAMPTIRNTIIDAYRARARQGSELLAEIRRRGIVAHQRSPLYRPEFIEQLNAELLLDADALSRSDLYWVSAPMASLAAEYSDSDAPWRPNVEAPSEFGMLLFADIPLMLAPLPPHGIRTIDGDQFASWAPEPRLPDGLPRVPLAGIRWAIRGDAIDISFYVRREQLREVFEKADREGNFLHPRELVDMHWQEVNGWPPLDFLPKSVRWMSTYSLDSETLLIEWERITLSATEDFSVVETERMKIAGADPTNALWLAGGIVPSIWTMMKSEKVATRKREQVVARRKSPTTGSVTTRTDDVSIIDVRPYKFVPHDPQKTGRKITVRFLVRGHMSTYWTGKGRKIPKRVFVAPFWKGDESLPIKNSEKVNIVR